MPSIVPEPSVPELSLAEINECKFGLVGEGRANVVFEVFAEPGSECSNVFQEQQEYWETIVRPLFRSEDLVQQRLIKLDGRELATRLNHILEEEEHSRRADFKGSRVAETEYGMLVEDMRKRSPDDFTLEFKPKWLAQSPSAPASAIRCRNCAKAVLQHDTAPIRYSSNGGSNSGSGRRRPKRILCPLDLLACADSPETVDDVLAHFSAAAAAAATDPVVDPSAAAVPSDRFAHWLRTNDLLPRLRAVQLANDRGGALSVGSAAASFDNGNGDNEDEGHDGNLSAAGRLQLAMTLRDCSCFLRVPADPDSPVEAKLGDLDKKNLAAKLRYWQQTEMRLIEGKAAYNEAGVGGI
ncbi:hypothetical protein VTH82DRAFT_5982 [Thermothelomyces myriococcoides]